MSVLDKLIIHFEEAVRGEHGARGPQRTETLEAAARAIEAATPSTRSPLSSAAIKALERCASSECLVARPLLCKILHTYAMSQSGRPPVS